jgi:hypothetical protein
VFRFKQICLQLYLLRRVYSVENVQLPSCLRSRFFCLLYGVWIKTNMFTTLSFEAGLQCRECLTPVMSQMKFLSVCSTVFGYLQICLRYLLRRVYSTVYSTVENV